MSIYLYNSITPNTAEYSIASSLTAFMTELGTPYATIDKTDCRIVNNELLTNQASPNTTYVIDFDTGKCYFVTNMIEYSGMTKLFLKIDNWGTYSRRASLGDGRITQSNMNVGSALINIPPKSGTINRYSINATDYKYSNSYVIAEVAVDFSVPFVNQKSTVMIAYGPIGSSEPGNLSYFLSRWSEIGGSNWFIADYGCAVVNAWAVPFAPDTITLGDTHIDAPNAPSGFPTTISTVKRAVCRNYNIRIPIAAASPGTMRYYGTLSKCFPKQPSTEPSEIFYQFHIYPNYVSVMATIDGSTFDVTEDFKLSTGFSSTENAGLTSQLKILKGTFGAAATGASFINPTAGQIVSLAGGALTSGVLGGSAGGGNTTGGFGPTYFGDLSPFVYNELTSDESAEEMENAKSFGLNTNYVFSNKTIAQVLSTGSTQYYTSTYKPFYKVDTTISGIPTDAADEIKRILSEGVRVNASISS